MVVLNARNCYLNERQKIRHYRARSRMPNGDFFTSRGAARKLRYYGDVIHSFDWKSAVKHDGGD